ncbi:hypothetical protein L3X38_012441 [Prunus dulcis]|uniref:Uncharacterized protein n=1 Tax=Prunus dulcis TaxID=3755 RepID=A0AAD4WJM5_PRUDU|nr:hypothetical protein L3X38_012441 [Prunus dulcis]
MSNLIRRRKAVKTTQSSPPMAQPSAVTAPTLMDHLPVGPGVSHAPASLVAQPVSSKSRHRPANTTDTTLTDATGASGPQPEHLGVLSVVKDGEGHSG